jgi:hypothetical protein
MTEANKIWRVREYHFNLYLYLYYLEFNAATERHKGSKDKRLFHPRLSGQMNSFAPRNCQKSRFVCLC